MTRFRNCWALEQCVALMAQALQEVSDLNGHIVAQLERLFDRLDELQARD